MIATRTLPSSRRAWPFELPLVDIGWSSVNQLFSHVQDALQNRDPGGGGEHDDRPLERAPGSEDEARGDDDDPLRAGAEADVAAQAERLRLRAGVRNEERAGDCRDREDDRRVVALTREDEGDGSEHRAFADAVGGGV